MNPMPLPKGLLALSNALAALLVFSSCYGLMVPGFYNAELQNWQIQSIGQDMVDLFLVAPSLVTTTYYAARNQRAATLAWGGIMLYLTYTFVIFCFSVHFNRLFIVYCVELGLSFFSSLAFLNSCVKTHPDHIHPPQGIHRVAGIYFVVVAGLFYLLWLSEIIPSIVSNTVPAILAEAGLFTNPVHALDLSVVLPGIFITGFLLLKKNRVAILFAPAVLSFFILMDLTIAFLTLYMYSRGLDGSPVIAMVMALLAFFSIVLLWKLNAAAGSHKMSESIS